jgi:hypothetical protein
MEESDYAQYLKQEFENQRARADAAEARVVELSKLFDTQRELYEKSVARVVVLESRRFPVQGGPSIPWGMILPHENTVKKNHHGQSLERMAQRGGLGPSEAICALRDWPIFGHEYSLIVDPVEILNDMVQGFENSCSARGVELEEDEGILDFAFEDPDAFMAAVENWWRAAYVDFDDDPPMIREVLRAAIDAAKGGE